MDSNGASLGYSDITAMYPGAISSWTRVGGRVTAPANSAWMQVQYLLYMSSGWVNIDDVEVTIVPPNAATEVTKYYYFGGQRVAMRKNGVLTYLHGDHLGSTVLETNASGVVTSDEKYKAYGKQRDIGTVSTDHRFTGQKEDASGLQYFNARFYDPVIGMFVSPDTIVPQPGLASDYNRYLAFRGNPMKFVDPTGHYSETEIKTYLKDTYPDDWQSYWDAWQADPYWMWLLGEAQDDYILRSAQGGDVTFTSKKGSFALSYGKLHEFQGKGAYQLLDNKSNMVDDPYWLGYMSNYGLMTSTYFRSGINTYYQPIYNYSSGKPSFSYWQLINVGLSPDTPNLKVGDAIPVAVTYLAERLPEQAAKYALKGLSYVGWATVANDVVRLTADYSTYEKVAQWPPYSATVNDKGHMAPIPNQWMWANPNGAQYPAPP